MFSRYNGILGDYFLNNHMISEQLMRRFLVNNKLTTISWPGLVTNRVLESLAIDDTDRGTLTSVGNDIEHHALLATADEPSGQSYALTLENDGTIHLSEYKVFKFLKADEYDSLCRMYSNVFDENSDRLTVSRRIQVLKSVVYLGESFQADNSERVNCNIIRARWAKSGYELSICPSEKFARAGLIRKIFVSEYNLNGTHNNLVLFEVDWYTMHETPYAFGNNLQVYHKTFCNRGSHSLMPIQRVLSKCAICFCKHENVNVAVAIPLAGSWAL